jgi:hypothetical protein
MIALTLGLLMLSACHSGHGADGTPFTVDTAQLKHHDSLMAAQRHTDSILLRKADSLPGINAGMNRFTVRTPTGWRRLDTLIGKIRAVMLDTASSIRDFRTNISIVGDSLRGLSVDDYLSGTVNSLTQYVPQFSLIGKGERPIDGRPSRWIHYSQDLSGTALENICYIVPGKGVVYIITCSALKGRLVKNYPAFERAIRSFALY